MRLNEKTGEGLQSSAEVLETELVESLLAEHRSYHEMEDSPIVELDTLSQLKANLQVLADLTARLSFLNREIRYVMKVD